MSLPVFAQSFPDVPKDHPNFAAIEYLDDKQILKGYEDGTFKPEKEINRAEAVKILVNGFAVPMVEETEILFKDVLTEDWFFKFVMAGYKAGIVKGYPDNSFKPANTIILSEALKIILESADAEVLEKVENDVYIDAKVSDWYAVYALFARDKNLVFADEYGKLNPGKKMTRGQFAEIVYRMIIVKEKNGAPFPLHTNWPTFKGSKIPFSIKYDPQWKIMESSGLVYFYHPDQEFFQFSPVRIYPNSAVVAVSFDNNDEELSGAEYFENLKAAFPKAKTTEFKLEGLQAMEVLQPEKLMVDWYVYLKNGNVLAVYTEYGNGLMGFQLPRYIEAMLSTFKYSEISGSDDNMALMDKIFKNVLVEGKGKEMLGLLDDEIIIETDSIGVGTGAVDYYYSSQIDHTIKYERAADTILAIRSGKTSAF